nr:myosin light chain kinase, smooth muscle isoform X2 [Ciona intestinalis]|eukprot:XP_002122169.1 myosin light chain kinase, smooth muscle isoform X2 [Ciona intestinalis]
MSTDRRPYFSQVLTHRDVTHGDRVRFECKVEGRPKPTVVWNKDGKVVTASSRVRVMEIYGSHSLVISRTEHTDNGVYSITASNHVGSETCSAQLHVQDMSASRGSSTSQLSAYGRSSSTRSSPSTSNLSSPSLSPKLARAATSRLVSGGNSPWSTGLKSSGSSGGAPPRRRGPGFILRPRPQTIAIGERLCLKCTLLGHPKPTVTWEKDGELVDEDRTDGRIRTTNDGNDYFLQIDECGAGDAGKYGVTARNSLGKQTAAVDVVVSGSGGHPTNNNNVTKSTPRLNKNNNDNNNVSRHDEPAGGARVTNVRTNRAMELILPSHKREEDLKESPTSSISSTISSHSRISTSSSRSNASGHHGDDTEVNRPIKSSWRRSNFVAPTFTRRLSSTQVLEGEELLLQCDVAGEPEPDLLWLRNGREVGIDEDEVFTSYRNGTARLRLRDVQVNHAGEYICKARNEAGAIQCSSRVTVKAKPVHIRPRFTKSPGDARVTEGDTLILEAGVEGSPLPEILWSLDGEEVSHGETSFENNVAKLIIRKIDTSHSGQYMCNALNTAGEDSVACRVRVKQKKRDIPPEFTAPLSDVKSKEGDDVCLRCMVTGIPEPTVQWMYNDEVLEAEEGLEIIFHEGVAALTLEQATNEDTGVYTCVAVNGEGRATTTCQVAVTAAPKVEKKSVPTSAPKFATTFDEYIRAQDGDKLVLECSVTGHPEPEVTWSLNDQSVPNTTASFKNGIAKLTIDPVSSTHSGHVKCSIQNTAGKANHEARVYVRSKRVAPTFEKELPESIVVNEGEEACFECQVRGHPQPRVTWSRDGRSLSVLSTETSYEDGKASVRIRKAGTREGGRYTCTARNLSGEAESVCIVTVATKMEEPKTSAPKFTKEMKDVELVDGQDLHLTCHVSGLPTPDVHWEVDGQRLEAEDGDVSYKDGVAKLVLEDVMKEDTGRYECIAKNEVGNAKSGCNVTVKAPTKEVEPVAPKAEVVPTKPTKPTKLEKEPSFPIQLDDHTVEEGDDIVLKCQVKGIPRPKITWLLDGEEILDAELKYDDDGHAHLVLPEALPEDEGVYTCIAENPLKRVMCSCKVTIAALAATSKRSMKPKPAEDVVVPRAVEVDSAPPSSGHTAPSFTKNLEDRLIQDGSTDVLLSCVVTGNPPPTAKWFFEDEELEDSDDFKMIIDGNVRSLVIGEVFPEDSGVYMCVAGNTAGEARSKCKITVEEIEGETPTFLMKPKQVNVNAGERALFSCRVDGDPPPSVEWLFCNQPIQESDRALITKADPNNNYTHSLEIPQVSPQDAGRYAVCCRNLLGDVTCTVSLIVSDAKKQETRKDFRDVLRKSPAVKTNQAGKPLTDEQVDFRGLLRRTSTDKDLGKRTTSTSGSEDAGDDAGAVYKEALSVSVKTKALTEEERKRRKAEQLDFRGNLVRKVEPKVTSLDVLRTKSPEQQDFREEALKTKVRTKALGQDDLKHMTPEQKDFRAEAIKSKVVTKAYKEELIKTKRAEQVDFRDVLSPTKKAEMERKEAESLSISELPRGKWRKESGDHNMVATKRTRHKGAAAIVPVRKVQENGRESEEEEEKSENVESKPEFTRFMDDYEATDGQPFTLECTVVGEPRPEITWYLDEEEVKAEADITITYEGDICRFSIAESFPDDQGKYSCTARNKYGESTCSAFVTVVGEQTTSPKPAYVMKKKSPSVNVPASIKDGPQDMTILRGNPISLCCSLVGTSPLKVVWRKGRNEIKHSHQCSIETTGTLSALTISKSERGDSGCYTLQVSNTDGVDQFSVSVSVVDVPDPPGKPFPENASSNEMIVSWYGSGFDGGSPITSYLLEMSKVNESGSSRKTWAEVSTTNSTSFTVKGLETNASYLYRVSASNKYGTSRPGPVSDVLRNVSPTQENGAESSGDEEDFVEYGPVTIKKEKFSGKYEVKEKLGQGRFGKVHRVVDRAMNREYAAKIMRALKARDREAVNMEIDIMNQLRHPRLVQLIDAYTHGREMIMVMDLVAGGELFERVIDEDFELTEAACIKYMRQICDGVEFMKRSQIVHLDLKPENIMCINKTGTQIKIIDFGLARKFNPNEVTRVMFGTPEFVAPEVINYDAIGFETDMWSVGVICYILLSGLSPFCGDADSETLSNITAVQWDFDDESFDQISEDAKDFISKLLVKELKQRFDVNQALQHRWLKRDTNKMSKSKLNKKNLRRFLARRKWQKTGNAVRALGRLASLARLAPSSSSHSGQQRESGFLSSLKAQLIRENESQQERKKPCFLRTFDDIEVIEGSAAKFSCTVSGNPDPDVMWLIDGEPIKESRHFRMAYTEDNQCTLLIMDTSGTDEAEYTCKASNSEGEVQHSAELIVITPGV